MLKKNLSPEEQVRLQVENNQLRLQLELICRDLVAGSAPGQPSEIKGRSGFARGFGGLGTIELNVRTGEGSWSEPAFKLIGVPRSKDLCGTFDLWKSAIHPDDVEVFTNAYARGVREEGAWSVVYRTVPDEKQGIRWLAVYGRCMTMDADPICRMIIFDITERKRAETESRENQVRLMTLTDNLPEGVVFQAKSIPGIEEKKLLYISKSAEKLLGVDQEAFRSNPRIGFEAIIPEHRKLLDEAERTALDQMKPYSVEVQYRRGNGELRWCRTISAPRSQPDGSVIWDGMMIDVTEQKLAAEAELRALRFQINPHFLFNTLAAVSTLIIDGQSERAEKMALDLSKFYRHLLLEPTHLTRLGLEVELIHSYLEIELIRFPDELEFMFDAPSDLDRYMVPSLIMQPIVENSIKYGIGAPGSKLRIEIKARAVDGYLVIEIADNGIFNKKSGGAGLGQRMTQRRLETIFGTDWSFASGPREAGGYAVEMRMPLKTDQAQNAPAPIGQGIG